MWRLRARAIHRSYRSQISKSIDFADILEKPIKGLKWRRGACTTEEERGRNETAASESRLGTAGSRGARWRPV
jgi:hypothetical protein